MSKLYINTKDESVEFVKAKDPVMKKLITVVGDIEIDLRSDYLASVVRSIIGQQISVAAASAIYSRLKDLLGGDIVAEKLLEKTKEQLHEVGLTKRKADYVKDVAEKIETGQLDLKNIAAYDNETIMKQLMSVKGIGKWTAEMFLILSLGRLDVLAVDDVGIQRAAKWLYQVEKSERRAILIEKSPIWKPYRSIASFYLWEAIHLNYISDYDSVDELFKTSK